MTVPWRVHACRPLTPRHESMGREAVRQRALTTDLLLSTSAALGDLGRITPAFPVGRVRR
jgi:hypothetical protein